MIFGLYLRNMGVQSAVGTLTSCARAAEAAGIDELWVADHVAIPPDDAEGSGGRYLDPLATLAYLAGVTERVRIGTGVLVLPYRPPLITAKWVATIQELSHHRLMLGVGAGWMGAEFRALGLSREKRGRITDETLEFLHRCFLRNEIEAHDQKFLFLPRPPRPPIFVGGSSTQALRRAVRFGEGWMPVGVSDKKLAESVRRLRSLAEEYGKPRPEVVMLGSLDLEDPPHAIARLEELRKLGVTRFVHASGYDDAREFGTMAETIITKIAKR